MHLRLIKLAMAKDALAARSDVLAYLDSLGRLDVLPLARCGLDATRVGAAYSRHYRDSRYHVPESAYLLFGTTMLVELDLRRLSAALLDDDATPLWPGLWLALGPTEVLTQIAGLAEVLLAGSLSVQSLSLARTTPNRHLLAQELGRQYQREMHGLLTRLSLPRPKVIDIETDYMRLCVKIRRAEEGLGMPLAGVQDQVEVEQRLRQE